MLFNSLACHTRDPYHCGYFCENFQFSTIVSQFSGIVAYNFTCFAGCCLSARASKF